MLRRVQYSRDNGRKANDTQIYTPDVEVVEELEQSVRGAGGFGSTG